MTTATLYERPRLKARPGETIVTSTCGHNCGGRCVVNAHVVDDRIVKISTDPARWQPGAAAAARLRPRRRPDRARLSSRPPEIPDASRRPARLGPVRAHLLGRGDGAGRRASCSACARTTAMPSILDASRSGSLSMLHGRGVAKRFFYKFGGCTDLWSNMSAEAEVFAVRMTFGAEGRLQDRRAASRPTTSTRSSS